MDSSARIDAKYLFLQKVGAVGDNIKIKDEVQVEKMLKELVTGGFSNLQFIVDFDYTLSKGHSEGEKSESSWSVLDNGSPEYVPEFYRKESNKLFEKYYPIEISSTMTEAEKIPHMSEWYKEVKELLVSCKLKKDALPILVKQSKLQLRDGTNDLFKKSEAENIPILILSAGMGDIVEEILRVLNVYSSHVKVVSNFFKYNEEGVMVDFVGEQIHMFNKNEDVIHSSDYFENLKNRRNVILMGDSSGDTKMAVGVPVPNNVLKIGFLNEKVEERLPHYMDVYDIVLIRDQTMNLVNNILSIM